MIWWRICLKMRVFFKILHRFNIVLVLDLTIGVYTKVEWKILILLFDQNFANKKKEREFKEK